MSNNEIAFVIFYGAISVAGLCVALHYWYYELYKKNGFVSSRFMVTVGKKGYGHSYSWKDRHLFFERNK